jgi:hypothetical protein
MLKLPVHSMADETLAPATESAPKSPWPTFKTLVLGVTLSRVQAIVGTLAGMASVIGVSFSMVQSARPATTGELVAIVQTADSRRTVSDAVVEVLTTENAIVATLTPDASGHAAKELSEGVYVVRVSHPRYAAEVRRVQVLPRQTVEIRTALRTDSPSPTTRTGSSSSIERAAKGGVNAVRKALRF